MNAKSLKTAFLSYSTPKPTIKFSLTFIKIEKTKHENFFLFNFFPFSNNITRKLHNVRKCYAYQMTTLLRGKCFFQFRVMYNLRLESYSLETVFKNALRARWSTLGPFFGILGMARIVRVHLAH